MISLQKEKNTYRKSLLILLTSFFFFCNLHAQILYDEVFINKTKSIKVTPSSDSLGAAILPLLGGTTLNVEFDILENESRYLKYKIIHCNRYWEKSELFESDYMNVSGELSIDKYENSFNTSTQYVHYSFSFPNENITLLLSGNYILQIYNSDDEIVLFQKRFVVTEQLIEIQSQIIRPNIVQYSNNCQQISMQIIPHGFNLSTYDKDLFVHILQNGRWDKSICGIQPNHISGDGILNFNNNQKELLFYGGAEFHQFNFKNFNYAAPPVEYFTHNNGIYNVILTPNKIQPSYIYNDQGDLNGRFLIDISQNFEAATSADYANVFISLPYHKNYFDTLDLYVCGGFNNWKLSRENKMSYNSEKSQFEIKLLLKQGYYDYTLVFASADGKTILPNEIDGSFYQTENDYEILVYFYDYQLGYDRVIGYQKIFSKFHDN